MKVPTVLIIGMLAMLGMASDAAAQKVKASVCGSDVGLNVTIAGTRSAPGGFGLVSDGLGTVPERKQSHEGDGNFPGRELHP